MVFLDDMVVVLHDFCCCCACTYKGEVLVLLKIMVVCVMRATVGNGDDKVVFCVDYVTYNCCYGYC